MIKIGIDLMGGDNAPLATLEGILHSLLVNKDLYIVATYHEETDINEILKKIHNFYPRRSKIRGIIRGNLWKQRLDLIPCKDYVRMDERSLSFIKNDDNTLKKIFNFLKEGKVDGVVYAGNTGAFLEGSVFIVGRLDNVKRPALLTALPFGNPPVFLLDSGANPECKPEYILQFAIMSSTYYKVLFSKKPIVGILNIGSEEIKGNSIVKESNFLIKKYIENNPDIFIYKGFVEPYDIVKSHVDIVLSDGFSGNIMLKSFEALSEFIMDIIKKEFSRGIITRALGLLVRSNFRRLRNFFDYSEYGGAVMLGLKGICIKTHGRANYKAIKNSIIFTSKLIKNQIISKIEQEIRNVKAWII
ncbi:MAG: phosphate acyltransferase PlsX [bacterium]